METQFLTDKKGNKTGVLLSMKQYNKLIEKLEDLEDVRLYDEAKGRPLYIVSEAPEEK